MVLQHVLLSVCLCLGVMQSQDVVLALSLYVCV